MPGVTQGDRTATSGGGRLAHQAGGEGTCAGPLEASKVCMGSSDPSSREAAPTPYTPTPGPPHCVPVRCHRPPEAGCPVEVGEMREGRVLRRGFWISRPQRPCPVPPPGPSQWGRGPRPTPLKSGVAAPCSGLEAESPLFSAQGVKKAGGVWSAPTLLGADAQGRAEKELLHGGERGPPPLCRAGPSGTGAPIPSPRPSELARPRENGLEAKSPFEGGSQGTPPSPRWG